MVPDEAEAQDGQVSREAALGERCRRVAGVEAEVVHYVVVALEERGRWMMGRWVEEVPFSRKVVVVAAVMRRGAPPCEGMEVGIV